MKKLIRFLSETASDPRIPARDKTVLAGLLAYLAMPFDLIPDFIPLLGHLDDLVVAIVVLDYIFNVVPEAVILDHFPWKPERYHSIRRWVRIGSRVIPGFVRRKLWKAAQEAKPQTKDEAGKS